MAGVDTRGIETSGLPEKPFPKVRHEFRVHVAQAAFDRIVEHGSADTSREVGGVLVGQVCREGGSAYVRVEATIDALHAEEKGTELTFTHATWEHIHAVMEKQHAGAKIVGWYHTHPNFGIFLSDRDQFIQRSFFNLPSQIALVYDPLKRESGVFAWRDNEPVRVRRWFVGDREQIWDGAHAPRAEEVATRAGAAPSQAAAAPPAQRAELPSERLDGATLAMFGLVLLLLGGFGGWWWAGRGLADLAQRQELQLQQARLLGQQEMARELRFELIAPLRAALDADARRKELEAPLAELARCAGELTAGQTPAADVAARVDAARRRVQLLADRGVVADEVLARIEKVARADAVDAQELRRQTRDQALVLAEVCAALGDAAKAQRDLVLAQRYFAFAARCNPDRAAEYQARLDAPASADAPAPPPTPQQPPPQGEGR